jgi:alkyldihydroxyacetonephosphate synthase
MTTKDAGFGSKRLRNFWGWGWDDEAIPAEQQAAIGALLAARLGITPGEPIAPPRIEEIALRAPRVAAPDSLAAILSASPLDRASHTYGKAFRDIVRGLRRDFSAAPDWVAHPRDEADVAALLDWCSDAGVAAIPYGGGSSVVGGVTVRSDSTKSSMWVYRVA